MGVGSLSSFGRPLLILYVFLVGGISGVLIMKGKESIWEGKTGCLLGQGSGEQLLGARWAAGNHINLIWFANSFLLDYILSNFTGNSNPSRHDNCSNAAKVGGTRGKPMNRCFPWFEEFMFTFLGLGSLLIITGRLEQSGKYRRSALLQCRDLIFPLAVTGIQPF